jgi:hypothetical protein
MRLDHFTICLLYTIALTSLYSELHSHESPRGPSVFDCGSDIIICINFDAFIPLLYLLALRTLTSLANPPRSAKKLWIRIWSLGFRVFYNIKDSVAPGTIRIY